ncbi:ATP synthase subunit c [Candidatus Protochlamydia amoebophila]|nr:ATP synthase subunit c [Candidatus Protochlamydia amoebophila]
MPFFLCIYLIVAKLMHLARNPALKSIYIKIRKRKTMSIGTALALSAPFAVGLAALGSGLGLGRAVSSAMEAIGRQPEASGKILTTMIIGAALIEALTIYALIVFFVVLEKMA